jgi:hypothetical protein
LEKSSVRVILIERLFGIFVTLLQEPSSAGRVSDRRPGADRASDPTIGLLAGLALVRHGVSFRANIRTTDQSPRRSDRKMAVRIVATM